MKTFSNEPLNKYTAFGVGGPAKTLVTVDSADDFLKTIEGVKNDEPLTILGYGTNCVVSDRGLDGIVLMMCSGPRPTLQDDYLVADAATSWDDLVVFAGSNNLWGVELMSGIPGNVGAALVGNIAAYGQAVSDTFAWAEVWDKQTAKKRRLDKADIELGYRQSSLQTSQSNLVVLKVAFKLAKEPTVDLEYASAVRVAQELGEDQKTLPGRRAIILETRKRAGSIYDESDPKRERTAGSFFKNPVVDEQAATELAKYDETGKSLEELLAQNRVHGGDQYRMSAALVLLAAGFSRGQSWGAVKLHDKHVLKIQNTGDATAQQIYDVVREIVSTVESKLNIHLEAEVKFVGEFGVS